MAAGGRQGRAGSSLWSAQDACGVRAAARMEHSRAHCSLAMQAAEPPHMKRPSRPTCVASRMRAWPVWPQLAVVRSTQKPLPLGSSVPPGGCARISSSSPHACSHDSDQSSARRRKRVWAPAGGEGGGGSRVSRMAGRARPGDRPRSHGHEPRPRLLLVAPLAAQRTRMQRWLAVALLRGSPVSLSVCSTRSSATVRLLAPARLRMPPSVGVRSRRGGSGGTLPASRGPAPVKCACHPLPRPRQVTCL